MNEISCETVLMAKLAEADGEKVELSRAEMDAHLGVCTTCQSELAKLLGTAQLFSGRSRIESDVDLWPLIQRRISVQPAKGFSWAPFILAAVLLIGYKLFEMLPERDPGAAIKLVPLVIVVLLFLLIRENPFRINPELILEK